MPTNISLSYIAVSITLLFSGCCPCQKLHKSAQAYYLSTKDRYLSSVESDEKLTDSRKKIKKLKVDLHGKALESWGQ